MQQTTDSNDTSINLIVINRRLPASSISNDAGLTSSVCQGAPSHFPLS
jgi:hypothetical protein